MKKSILIVIIFLSFWNQFAAAQLPDWKWVKSAGGASIDAGYSVCTDVNGNVYVTGIFESPSINFGSFTLTNTSTNHDIFTVKYDSNGNVIWAKSIGGINADMSNSICVDASGNVIVTGYFYSPVISFGSTTLTNTNTNNTSDIYIVKYDSSGNVLWAKSAGGISDDGGKGVSTDANDNIYLTGFCYSIIFTIGSSTLINSSNYIAKYDSNGTVLWAKSAFGNCANIQSVANDNLGNIIITGSFACDSVQFGTTTLFNTSLASYTDCFIAKYDGNGNELWAKTTAGNYNETGFDVSTDSFSNVIVSGEFDSPTMTIGSNTYTNSGSGDIFIAKYNSSGNLLWSKHTGGSGIEHLPSIVSNTNGNIFVSGSYSSPNIPFGTIILTNTSSATDMFLMEYDPSGNVLWATSFGGNLYDYCTSLCNDASGNAIITGYFHGNNINFGTTSLISAGASDFFIAKISQCTPSFASQTISACNNFLSPSQNYNYTSSGIYQDTLINTLGCDSIITINLTINPSPIVAITASGATSFCLGDSVVLSAQSGLINYQWYRKYVAIPGATTASYTAKNGGIYKCFAQSTALCPDTSNLIAVRIPCIPIDPNQQRTTTLYESKTPAIHVFPNPGNGIFTIHSPSGHLQVYNSIGNLIYETDLFADVNMFDISEFPDGIYIVSLNLGDLSVTQKILIVK